MKYLKAADHLQVIINVLVQSLNQRLLLIVIFQYNSFNTWFYYKRRINLFFFCSLWKSEFSILGITIVFLMSFRYWKWFKALKYKDGFKFNINVWSNIRKNVSFFFYYDWFCKTDIEEIKWHSIFDHFPLPTYVLSIIVFLIPRVFNGTKLLHSSWCMPFRIKFRYVFYRATCFPHRPISVISGIRKELQSYVLVHRMVNGRMRLFETSFIGCEEITRGEYVFSCMQSASFAISVQFPFLHGHLFTRLFWWIFLPNFHKILWIII